MQDIGGIRVIVPKLGDVYVLHNASVNGAYQHDLIHQNVDKPHIELVLICVKDFKEVQKAYPNYFLDTQAFIANLTKLL